MNFSFNREIEEKKLKEIFGFNKFFDTQWDVISKVMSNKRILLIEKTGFGKSLCYQYSAVCFPGLTIIISPLIALMRDQIKFLDKINIPSASINSGQTPEKNQEIIEKATRGEIKILYIAPERQGNITWLENILNFNISFVVIDEAHCISTWGHDFRPYYRRIIDLIDRFPTNFPVLATTATATKRVQKDIEEQIGSSFSTIRGNLLRKNLYLNVLKVENEEEKFLWLAENISNLEGSGIIYTGTRANSELFSRWLNFHGVNTAFYNATLESEERIEIENGFMNNKFKCVVSTNALGMGIDKPDIRFIIHTQITQSPVHYYQEIGRAGRDGKPAKIILLYNPAKDSELPLSFIESAKPDTSKYFKVIEALREARHTFTSLIKKVDLKQTVFRVILADLIDMGIVVETIESQSKKYELKFNAPGLNFDMHYKLKEAKFLEFGEMLFYANTQSCRMNFLCNYLGDNGAVDCLICDNDLKIFEKVPANDSLVEKLSYFKENYFPEIIVEGSGSNIVNGVAADFYGFSNTGQIIHKAKYENHAEFPETILFRLIAAFQSKFDLNEIDIVTVIPSTISGDIVPNLAKRFSEKMGLNFSPNLVKTRVTQPQKVFQTNYNKSENIKNAFDYLNPSQIVGKTVLLIDDVFDSGITIKEAGRVLTRCGAAKIIPLTIAKTITGID